jgi:hypothetical protein
VSGHGFSRAEKALYFCHSEGTLVSEESAFPRFSIRAEALVEHHRGPFSQLTTHRLQLSTRNSSLSLSPVPRA